MEAPTRDERREVAAKLRKYIPYAKMHDKQGDYAWRATNALILVVRSITTLRLA